MDSPFLVACCGQNSVCKPYHEKTSGMHSSFKDTMIMCQAQVLEADFQFLPSETSPAWGPLMWVKWNLVLLSLSPQQWLSEVAAPGSRARRVPGVRGCDFFAEHLKTESGGISASALCLFLLVCWYLFWSLQSLCSGALSPLLLVMLYFLKTSQQAPAQPQLCCCYPLGTVSADCASEQPWISYCCKLRKP